MNRFEQRRKTNVMGMKPSITADCLEQEWRPAHFTIFIVKETRECVSAGSQRKPLSYPNECCHS